MPLEIFMNVTEALVHLFLINSLIPAKNNQHKGVKSLFFIVYVTIMYCIMTYFDLNFELGITIIVALALFLYTCIRNNKGSIIKRVFVSLLSLFLIDFSISIAFFTISNILKIFSIQVIGIWETIRLLLIVAVSRVSYLLMAKLILYIYKNKPKNFFISKKYMVSICMIITVYSLSIELFFTYFWEFREFGEATVNLMLIFGCAFGVTFLLLYFIIKNHYMDAIKALEMQKTAFDNTRLANFTDEIEKFVRLKNEIIDLTTPAVQLVNNYEYEEARQMIQDILNTLDENMDGIDYHCDSQIEAVIKLKIEECKFYNISVIKAIKNNKTYTSIFTNVELLSVITNLFDISIRECDNFGDKNSLYFAFDTRETGVLLETEYQYNENFRINESTMIDFLPEKLLKLSLNKLGGYTTVKKIDGRIKRKVFLPYAGKAYYLRGANSRSAGVDI